MGSPKSPKAKQDTSSRPEALSSSEYESMMQEMRTDAKWMKQELARLREAGEAPPTKQD